MKITPMKREKALFAEFFYQIIDLSAYLTGIIFRHGVVMHNIIEIYKEKLNSLYSFLSYEETCDRLKIALDMERIQKKKLQMGIPIPSPLHPIKASLLKGILKKQTNQKEF
jgi:uncharacterized pyridoxal phosphate-containing UPF0001 family protein